LPARITNVDIPYKETSDLVASIGASALASQDGAGAAAVVAVVAASNKNKNTNVKGNEYPLLFCYILYDDLYLEVNMTLRGIDPTLNSNPIQEKNNEQPCCDCGLTIVMTIRFRKFFITPVTLQ